MEGYNNHSSFHFFAVLSVDQIGLILTLKHLSELARLGMAIIQVGNEQLQVVHPTRPYIQTIDVVEFYDPKGHAHLRGKSVVILGEGQVDRRQAHRHGGQDGVAAPPKPNQTRAAIHK